MTTTKEIQEYIFTHTQIKTSVKKGTGSMKGYYIFTPLFQNGSYPNFPFDFVQSLYPLLPDSDINPTFAAIGNISVYGLTDDRIEYKKERKPLPITEKKTKSWGSKNSQMRLDKAGARFGKRLRRDGRSYFM